MEYEAVIMDLQRSLERMTADRDKWKLKFEDRNKDYYWLWRSVEDLREMSRILYNAILNEDTTEALLVWEQMRGRQFFPPSRVPTLSLGNPDPELVYPSGRYQGD